MAWKAHVENLVRWGLPGYRLYLMRETQDRSGYEMMVKPTIKKLNNSCFAVEGDAFLDDGSGCGRNVREFLQAMSDAAWDIGIKPKQIEDNSNELKATKYHLEDMRAMVLGPKEKPDAP